MIVVEFQPSGWSHGSYLNVGCMWLWNVKPYLSFDVGYRIDKFYAFGNNEQFNPVAEKLATRALEKVKVYRRLFQTIRHVSDYYTENIPKSFWPRFNASIAHCLAGQIKVGRRLLSTCAEKRDDDRDWVKEAQSDAESLLAIMEDGERFRDVITGRVQEARRLRKLPPLEVNFNSRFPD